MTIVRTAAVLAALLPLSGALPAGAVSGLRNRPLPAYTVIITRHGVRSPTKTPTDYTWPAWNGVDAGYLTKHGYDLMRMMGSYYKSQLGITCKNDAYVYADVDQRTIETGRALIDGMCGSPDAVPLDHAPDVTKADPFFEGRGGDDAGAAAEASAAASHGADFTAFQALLDARCGGSCKPLLSDADPVKTASTYAENVLLEDAECGPQPPSAGLLAGLRLHALHMAQTDRPQSAAIARSGNMLAHVLALLQEHARVDRGGVDVPDSTNARVAIVVGHDTTIATFGGMLRAHWGGNDDVAADDVPPGAALRFDLVRTAQGEPGIRAAFVYQTLAQMRSAVPLTGGVREEPLAFGPCGSADNCIVPLAHAAAEVAQLQQMNVVTPWPQSNALVHENDLADPSWSACK